jgi:hypothetical protein
MGGCIRERERERDFILRGGTHEASLISAMAYHGKSYLLGNRFLCMFVKWSEVGSTTERPAP